MNTPTPHPTHTHIHTLTHTYTHTQHTHTPSPTNYGTTTATWMWTNKLKTKTKPNHVTFKLTTGSIVRFSPQRVHGYHQKICLTLDSIGRFWVTNILMFDSAWCQVMAQIQFSLIKKSCTFRILVTSPPSYIRYHLIFTSPPSTPYPPHTHNNLTTLQHPSCIIPNNLEVSPLRIFKAVRRRSSQKVEKTNRLPF